MNAEQSMIVTFQTLPEFVLLFLGFAVMLRLLQRSLRTQHKVM